MATIHSFPHFVPSCEPDAYPPGYLVMHSQTLLDTLASLPFGHGDHDYLLANARRADEQTIMSPARTMPDNIHRLRLLRRLLVDQEELDPDAFPMRLLDATLRDLGVDDPTAED